MHILPASLLAVAGMAEALPVVPDPEEDRIASVRLDVVHVRGLHVSPLLLAFDTEGVGSKVCLPSLLPGPAVSPGACTPYLFRVHRFVSLAKLCPSRHQLRAAGMLAGDLRFRWHNSITHIKLVHIQTSFSIKKRH